MSKKVCPVYKKTFLGHGRKKYCSSLCKFKAPIETKPKKVYKKRRKSTLCWDCENACTNCSWSKSLVPVEGWEATPIRIKINAETGQMVDSYIVNWCPLFSRSKRRG